MAKKAIVMRATVNEYSEISFNIYRKPESNNVLTFRFTEKAKAIEHLKFSRRKYILDQLVKLRKDVLNKELSKI